VAAILLIQAFTELPRANRKQLDTIHKGMVSEGLVSKLVKLVSQDQTAANNSSRPEATQTVAPAIKLAAVAISLCTLIIVGIFW
jgi:ribosomal protein L16/L10AE